MEVFMVTIELNVDKRFDKVKINDNILFNALLGKNHQLIKKYIKSISPFYKISDAFFEVVNNFVDFDSNGVSLYGGLVIRTGLSDYVILYLEGSTLDEEYMVKVIDDYIKDTMDYVPEEVNVNKFEVRRELFLSTLRKL